MSSFIALCVSSKWDLSNFETTCVISSLFFGSMIGALFWGRIADIYGRRLAALSSKLFYFLFILVLIIYT